MTHKRNKPGEAKSAIVRDIPAACADEALAVEFLEKMRFGTRPFCPRCGDEHVSKIVGRNGRHAPRFLWRCYGCKEAGKHEQFTWRIGTPAEDSRIPARCWTYALWRSATSKKGVSAKEIERQTGLTYKSALFLLQRIRFGMGVGAPTPGRRAKGVVEIDETYVGGKPRHKSKQRREAEASGAIPATPEGVSGKTEKRPVVGLIERGGALRLRMADTTENGRVTARTVTKFVKEHVDSSARVMTDESNIYARFGRRFKGGHETVNHKEKEYARGDVTTNTIEGAFGILKRGIYGIWHSVSPDYLPLYLNDVEFRYNTRKLEDGARVKELVRACEGKRLTYRPA
jgi:transposase-like protein